MIFPGSSSCFISRVPHSMSLSGFHVIVWNELSGQPQTCQIERPAFNTSKGHGTNTRTGIVPSVHGRPTNNA